MKLKGTMTIELTDAGSGETETIREENMVTDAVDNILGSNLLGVYFDSGTSSKNITVNSQLLPICPNTLGGILLFADTLEERKDNLYPMSANYPVAYASNDVNLGTDTARGSMNQTESGPIDRGYKFVWDFTTSRGRPHRLLGRQERVWERNRGRHCVRGHEGGLHCRMHEPEAVALKQRHRMRF